jgi:hypothetical protein
MTWRLPLFSAIRFEPAELVLMDRSEEEFRALEAAWYAEQQELDALEKGLPDDALWPAQPDFADTSFFSAEEDGSEELFCEPLDGLNWRFSWRERLSSVSRTAYRGVAAAILEERRRICAAATAVWSGTVWTIRLPIRIAAWTFALPGRFVQWVVTRPWDRWLTVRKGFVVGLLAGLSVVGTSLWALTSLPYLPGHPPVPAVMSQPIPISRSNIPSELAWFFIQFPYISENAQVRVKNLHTFVVSDGPRKREYVISVGQKFRRVEIYSAEIPTHMQVQIFTPGVRKTVSFEGRRVVGQTSFNDGNLWMWHQPLWNARHLKIYGLADVWLNSPYKRYSCAGFVHRFLRDAGVSVPVLDAWDLDRQRWTSVAIDELEPGDIITFKALTASHRRFWGHRVTHVGVYIGNGKMIHAATANRRASRSWIRVADVDDWKPRINKILRPPELL